MKHLPVIVAMVVALIAFVPSPAPRTPGPVSSALVGASRGDKAKVKGTYLSLAEVTERDNGALISTVAMWRQLHSNTLKLAASELRGKYAGLDVAVEKVMADSFPLDDVAMSGALVAKIAGACREVAHQSE